MTPEHILESWKLDNERWREALRSDNAEFIEFCRSLRARSGVESMSAAHKIFEDYWRDEAAEKAKAQSVEGDIINQHRRRVAIEAGA